MGNSGDFNNVVTETVSLNNLRIIHSMKNDPVIRLAISEKKCQRFKTSISGHMCDECNSTQTRRAKAMVSFL
jgi:hypothetical protein